MFDIKDKRIVIIGAARSGIGAARMAKKLGAIPFVSDSGSPDKLQSSIEIFKKENIEFEISQHSEKVLTGDLVVVSPGVPSDSEIIKKINLQAQKVISEVEFASRFCAANIIAITGTNGKTTTTALCGYLFEKCNKHIFTAGNIGLAFSEVATKTSEGDYVSLEVSSFQLDLIDSFKPKIAMILNITPDHLNRYENSVEKYALSKMRIFENQDSSDYLILNKDSVLLNEHFKESKSSLLYFSTKSKVKEGCYLDGEKIIFISNDKKEFICNTSDLIIKGEHNIQNALPVIIAAKIFDLNNECIAEALRTFKGVEHRLEFVREIGGVTFINDSKATNIDSVEVALKSFNEPIFLIMGGQDKGNDYSSIEQLILDKVKKIYAIGSSAEKIFNYFHNKIKTEIKKDFNEVINSALSEARIGEVVLLSPACASFDMFDNYEHRGKVFKEVVNNR